jgi:hypothetical protein
MRPNRSRRTGLWLLAAAIVSGPMVAGCGDGQQATGPAQNIPKESPVVQSKESMQDFMNQRKAREAQTNKR